jgi:hypothetical protein
MIVAIADTHTNIWYLFSDPRLGKAASAFIDDAIANGDHIGVSADPKAVLRHVAPHEGVALKMTEIPRRDLPDLPDRAIAARAMPARAESRSLPGG